MSLNLEVTVAPTLEPISLDEAKDHLRITLSDEDAAIDALILAARQYVEGYTSTALLTQTIKRRLNRFPCRIWLPRRPCQSVSSITYVDTNGDTQTLSADDYAVYGARTTPDLYAPLAYIEPAYGESWPSTRPVPDAVSVTYVAGWKSVGAIPQTIRQAMLVALADLYEQRETLVTGSLITSFSHLPTVDRLLVNEVVYHEWPEEDGI